MSSWWKFLVIFLSGLLLGGAITGYSIHCVITQKGVRSTDTDHILRRLSDQLDLTNAQRASVATLLKEEAPKMEALRREMQDKSHALWTSFDNDLRPLLDDSQKKKLDSMETKWQKHQGWKVGIGGVATFKEDGPVTEGR
ncbi:MAG TPA: hypothetical protein VMV05_05030 [bacterium]|nr:hypothetical protein [bacterium]